MIDFLVKGPIMKSKSYFKVGSTFIYTYNHLANEYQIDNFYTPILYQFNNQERNTSIVVNDYPFLKMRELIVEKTSIENLQKLHKVFQDELVKKNLNFDV